MGRVQKARNPAARRVLAVVYGGDRRPPQPHLLAGHARRRWGALRRLGVRHNCARAAHAQDLRFLPDKAAL